MKISPVKNEIVKFMMCKIISGESEKFKEMHVDENGMYDVTIILNGQEVNTERFFESLFSCYQEEVKVQAADLLQHEYGKLLDSIYKIQEKLEYHDKIFHDKVVTDIML